MYRPDDARAGGERDGGADQISCKGTVNGGHQSHTVPCPTRKCRAGGNEGSPSTIEQKMLLVRRLVEEVVNPGNVDMLDKVARATLR